MSIRLFILPFLGFALLGAAAPQPAGLEGEWRNTNNTVRIRVAACGPALCGTVIWATEKARVDARKGSGKDLIGSQLLGDLRQRPDGSWKGRAYVPDLDRNGSATITQLSDVLLRVSGCVFAGIVCRAQHWHRIG